MKKKTKPKVWMCNCGSPNFWLFETGEVRCAECKETSAEIFCHNRTLASRGCAEDEAEYSERWKRLRLGSESPCAA